MAEEITIPLDIARKFVSSYENCDSCYEEYEEFDRDLSEASYRSGHKEYFLHFCCEFPRDELTHDVWEKIINAYYYWLDYVDEGALWEKDY